MKISLLVRYSVIFVACLGLAFGGVAIYQHFDKLTRWSDRSYENASDFQRLVDKAENGDAEALYRLAVKYDHGDDVQVDDQKAFELYLKAAEKGYSKAQHNVGVIYERGEGAEKDLQQALYWYQKSAEQNDSKAQYNLATLYYNGRGVDKNIQKAFELYQRSAAQSNPDAQYNLAVMYHSGIPVRKDIYLAGELYRKAANANNSSAQNYINKAKDFCLKSDQGDDNKLETCIVAASAGVKEAQRQLMLIYAQGDLVQRNYVEAYAWAFIYSASFPKEKLEKPDKQEVIKGLMIMLSEMNEEQRKHAEEKAKAYLIKYGRDKI